MILYHHISLIYHQKETRVWTVDKIEDCSLKQSKIGALLNDRSVETRFCVRITLNKRNMSFYFYDCQEGSLIDSFNLLYYLHLWIINDSFTTNKQNLHLHKVFYPLFRMFLNPWTVEFTLKIHRSPDTIQFYTEGSSYSTRRTGRMVINS